MIWEIEGFCDRYDGPALFGSCLINGAPWSCCGPLDRCEGLTGSWDWNNSSVAGHLNLVQRMILDRLRIHCAARFGPGTLVEVGRGEYLWGPDP